MHSIVGCMTVESSDVREHWVAQEPLTVGYYADVWRGPGLLWCANDRP